MENFDQQQEPSEGGQPENAAQPAPAAASANRNLWFLWPVWLLAAFLAGGLVSYYLFAAPLSARLSEVETQVAQLQSALEQEAAAIPTRVPEKVIRYDVPVDDDPGFGPADAPILIVEFSDYECPFCRKWHNETWPQLQAKYGDQIHLVYRDFPLYGTHANAAGAAQAAQCAGDQDRYWEFHNSLFTVEDPYSQATFVKLASDIGLDMNTFNQCYDSGKYVEEVKQDYEYAASLGVTSTPTFFINGLAVVGAQPFEVFDRLITMELNGEIPLE